jgi:PAS domain S-box-containing protein
MRWRSGGRDGNAWVVRVCLTLALVQCGGSFGWGAAAENRDVPRPSPAEQVLSLDEAERGAKKVLTSLQQVRQLSTAEASRAYPVRVRGVVTYYDPSWWNILFVQDATAGIYVKTDGQHLDLKPGDLVEMEAETAPGEYAPVVTRPRFQTLAQSAMPMAPAWSFLELSSGRKDSHWVEVKGIVHAADVRDHHLFLEVATDSGRFEAMLPGVWNQAPAELVNARVRLRGVCGAVFNQRRQLTGIQLFVPGPEFISTEKSGPADPFSLPVRGVASLLQFSTEESVDHRVRVSGTVTLRKPDNSFYIQDETGGVFVKTRQADPPAPGDHVDVVGFPSIGEVTPILTASIFRKTGRRPLPKPAAVTAQEARNTEFDHEVFDARRVRIRARLLDAGLHSAAKQMVLQDGSEIFSAIVEGENQSGALGSLRNGSVLQLTGVCAVKVDRNRDMLSFQIQLAGPGDIRVLESPSWWTPERAFGVTGGMVVVLLTALGFVVALRRRVHGQTEVIRLRLEREAALEERYRDLVENANDFIYTHDLDGRYLSFNQAGLKLTGYSRDEILTMKVDQLVAPEFRNLSWGMLERKIERGGVTTYEVEYLAKDGRGIQLEISSRLIYQDGKPVGVQGIARDITERKRAEVELRKAKEAAEQASRTKSEFLANMSHEIRTPLNGVIGMTNLLAHTRLTPEQHDYVETARTSGDALLSVINDILDFSKIEAGELHFETLDFDLASVVEETLELLAPRAQNKSVELGSLIEPTVPLHVRGDPGRLRQVILNLVNNAIKFTTQGEVLVEAACVEETATDALLRFEISDTGIGISPGAQTRLFKPFSQADGSTTRKYGGTGLGLVICKQLVERMGGEIGFRTAEGLGSTFWFTVRLPKQSIPSSAVNQHNLAELRVLIVHDHRTQRNVLTHHLRAWRVRNGLTCAPEDALKFLRSAAEDGAPYHLILLDLQCPEDTGLPLARAIKSAPELSASRLILLAPLHHKPIPPALRAGAIDAVLTKPVRPSVLYDCFADLLHGRGSNTVRFHRNGPGPVPRPVPDATTLPSLRVLVAEDNAVNQKVAVRQLEKLGCSCADVAGNGLEAIEALKRSKYDVILMDCQMPEMDGYEATRCIRQLSAAGPAASQATVHIIAMTANAMEGDRELCLAAGMDDYLSKPMRLEELRSALGRVPRDPVAGAAGPQRISASIGN